MTAIQLILAVLVDAVLGEPSRGHPLILFGTIAQIVEKIFYRKDYSGEKGVMRLLGLLALIALIAPPVIFVWWLCRQPLIDLCAQILPLYFAIGMRSLREHAMSVGSAGAVGDLSAARRSVSKIVSRDTEKMSGSDVCTAAIESVLENGNDAVFAPIFWFLLLGAPGALLYRLANTLDAMWGYKTERYIHFGWAAARFDDVLNWLPARLTALTYVILGDSKSAWHCWHQQAKLWYSPNAGPVMSAGAGALGLRLGGAAIYHGKLKERPSLGAGNFPGWQDIYRAVTLVERGLVVWVLFVSTMFILIFLLH